MMRLFRRFAERRPSSKEGRYVCTLCGARFEDRMVVICPECRGFVVEREG
jgi:hypothetical protein